MIQRLEVEKKEKQELKEAFHMDDLLITSDDKEKVQKLLSKTKEGLYPQFNLTKVYSNIKEIREKYQAEVIECLGDKL